MTTRREFIQASAAMAAAAAVPDVIARTAWGGAGGSDSIRVGVIGCGGRGSGAVLDALRASPASRLAAMADVFPDRLNGSRGEVTKPEHDVGDRAKVSDDACFTGFDAYKRLLAEAEVDVVILSTPPGFRPIHFEAAVNAGKHVFMEKPVAVDGPGIRRVLAAGELAARKKLSVVAGTQRRHETVYLETLKRLKDGAIGPILSGRVYWNQGGLWCNPRQPGQTDMEYMLRNWYYFAWLSGDHNVEQHVHNLDVANWFIGAHPIRAMGMGGRQVRTGSDYGHIFDHHAVEYEYPGDIFVTSMARQIDGCANRVYESFRGPDGSVITSSGSGEIKGKNPWKFKGPNNHAYVQEHADLHAAIQSGGGGGGGAPLNETRNVAEATLTAIMGRMSNYTGKEVTWEQALNSTEVLSPVGEDGVYEFGKASFPEVAVPGKTPLV
jgi:predicted dehydrogenase